MKRVRIRIVVPMLGLVTATILSTVSSSANTIIAKWTFEAHTPADLYNSTTISGINADIGSGIASGVHANAGTDWSTPKGNGSPNALSANDWAVHDYWQFQVSTHGFENISLSWDQASSKTGPQDFALEYSTDGTGFSVLLNYTVLGYNVSPNSAWSDSTSHSYYNFSPDTSSITVLDSKPTVYFRLVDKSSTSAEGDSVSGGGTDRIDNFLVTGTRVPASPPGLAGWCCLLGLLAVAGRFGNAARKGGQEISESKN